MLRNRDASAGRGIGLCLVEGNIDAMEVDRRDDASSGGSEIGNRASDTITIAEGREMEGSTIGLTDLGSRSYDRRTCPYRPPRVDSHADLGPRM